MFEFESGNPDFCPAALDRYRRIRIQLVRPAPPESAVRVADPGRIDRERAVCLAIISVQHRCGRRHVHVLVHRTSPNGELSWSQESASAKPPPELFKTITHHKICQYLVEIRM